MSSHLQNAAVPIPIAVDHRSPARAAGPRSKFRPASVGHTRGPVSPEIAKVGLSEICLSYRTQSGQRLLALDHINLEVKPGEFLCVVGPSGCGKSTLLHLIAGLHQQTSGQILVDGKPVEGAGTDRILIFQELGLFPWLTVGQNVEFGMKMKGVSKAGREEKTRYYLRLVHLSQFKDSYIHQLSGGMRQRVALARALATEPDVLLMDEPFAALDALTRRKMQEELVALWEEVGFTVIFVTHSIEEALLVGSRILVLSPHPGRVKAELNAHNLGFSSIGTPEFEALHRRIHDLLFTDKIETDLAPEAAHG